MTPSPFTRSGSRCACCSLLIVAAADPNGPTPRELRDIDISSYCAWAVYLCRTSPSSNTRTATCNSSQSEVSAIHIHSSTHIQRGLHTLCC
jgi:hypothetical protein